MISLDTLTPNKLEGDLKSAKNELGKIVPKIEKFLEELSITVKKYDFLEQKELKIIELWNGHNVSEVYSLLNSFYNGVEHAKINKDDIDVINNKCANIIQQIELNNTYNSLIDEYEILLVEKDKKKQEEAVKKVNNLLTEKDNKKSTGYKSDIISNIENSMVRGPGQRYNNNNNNNNNMTPGERLILEQGLAVIRRDDTDHDAKVKKALLKYEHELKNPEDPNKKEKDKIANIVDNELLGSILSPEDQALLKKYPVLARKERARAVEEHGDVEVSIRKIAEAEIKIENGESATVTAFQKSLLKEDDIRDKVDSEKTIIIAEGVKQDVLAQRIANGEKPSKFPLAIDKTFYKKHKDAIDDKVSELSEDVEDTKKEIIEKLAKDIANSVALTDPADLANFDKYKTEITALARTKLESNKKDIILRQQIALLEINKESLNEEQELFLNLPRERANIDAEKARIEAIITKLIDKPDESTLSVSEKTFYTNNKEVIDAQIVKDKETKLKKAKEDLVLKIASGSIGKPLVLTPQEIKLEQDHKAEIDEAVLKKLKEDLATVTAVSPQTKLTTAEINRIKALIESRIRLSKKTMKEYEPLIKRFQEVNDRINVLEAKSKLGAGEQELLDALKQEKDEIYASLDKLGPSGRGFADLEIARNDLAKSSQEFQKTFVRKFPTAKILGVIAGMFGSKWSAVKETEATAGAQEKMRNAQHSYDKVREGLMNTFIGEEYAVREAFGQDLKNLNKKETEKLREFLDNVSERFIDKEYEKLEKAKNVLEGTVRGSAMRRFGQWYSKGGPYKNIKNPVLRKVLNRVTSGIVLSSALFLLPGVGAGAAFGSYLGYRATRAAVSGTVGESSALGVATLYGGKLNKKGEFTKFAEKRDKEFKKSRIAFVENMMLRLKKEEKPLITPSLMQKLNENHAKTVSNYMNSQGNARRAEMWTRLITGGAMAYGMTHLLPNPVPTSVPIPGHEDVPGIIKGPGTNPGNFKLIGDFVKADSRGFAQTFINLKEKMISHYASQDAFKGLSHDQIAQKILATHKLDAATSQIMGAKNTQDFMNLSEEHGFWLPKGAGNSNFDSGSVPAGSDVGMEIAPDGNMRLFVQLPNNTKIPFDNNFSEALNKYKGVTMIDSDHLGNRVSPGSNIANPGPATAPDLKPDLSVTNPEKLVPIDQPAPDTGLDASDYPPGQAPGDGVPPTSPITTPEKIVTTGGQDLTPITETPAPATGGATLEDLKSMYDLKIENINENLAQLKKIANPGTQVDYYKKLGYDWTGFMDKSDIKGPKDVITSVSENQGTMNYYAIGHKNLAIDANGDLKENWKPLEESDMYKTYKVLRHNYEVATNKIELLKNQKNVLETEHLKELHRQTMAEAYPDQANADAHGPSAADGAEVAVTNKLEAAGDAKFDSWVEKAFSKNHLFRKDTSGFDTKAWNNVKNENANDFMNGTHGSDETYNYSIREKRLYNILNDAQDSATEKFGYSVSEVAPLPNETVEQFADRMADISAKMEASKNLASGSR